MSTSTFLAIPASLHSWVSALGPLLQGEPKGEGHVAGAQAAAEGLAAQNWGFDRNDILRLLAVPLLPLVGYVIQLFVGRKLPRKGDWLLTSFMFCGLGIAVYEFAKCLGCWSPEFAVSSRKLGMEWPWFSSQPGVPNVIAGVLYDNLAATMLVVVTLVSSLVHLFSVGYMHGDSRYNLFFANISLFSFAMLGLVLSDNLLFFFIFWELMGLCSYLLIGHFYYKDSARRASLKAFMTTRIGDVCLLAGLFLLWKNLGTFSFTEIYDKVGVLVQQEGAWPGWLTAAGILVFCGAVGKSAQFPLHVWLPDAMEGPTPVSAMIHAATMVAAGVYLVGRSFPFLSPDARLVVSLVGSFTAIFAATIGICANDIKKVLAYSTVSQLGFMIAGIGVGGVSAGLFHMVTHACFKGCLFLGSGSVIHAVHTQDMREMGALRKKMPITYFAMLASTLAIAGVPFFAGFYSKDAILGRALARAHLSEGQWWYWLPFLFLASAASMTAFYMFRLVHMTFHGEPKVQEKFDHAHESGPTMAIPLIVLGALALFSGYHYQGGVPQPWAFEKEGWFLELWENPVPFELTAKMADPTYRSHVAEVDHHSHNIAMIVSLIVASFGIALSFLFYSRWAILSPAKWAAALRPIHTTLVNKYWVDELYSATFIAGTLTVSKVSSLFDKYVVDGIVNTVGALGKAISFGSASFDRVVVDGLVNFAGLGTQAVGSVVRLIQTGRIQQYLAFSMFALVVVAAVLILR